MTATSKPVPLVSAARAAFSTLKNHPAIKNWRDLHFFNATLACKRIQVNQL